MLIRASVAVVAALLSALFIYLLNLVLQEVVKSVNAEYAEMLANVPTTNVVPYLYPNKQQTSDNSNAVGTIWNTMAFKTKLIPFVPLSIDLCSPPVCLFR
eukprot:NODE_518_length_6556_cov_0.505653.p6 type:complete len:100 gc:universal NODE_518_length_6556_cov_0.505653:1664-1963(+)